MSKSNDDNKNEIVVPKDNNRVKIENTSQTASNFRTIILSAMSLVVALGFNDLVREIFDKYNIYSSSQILSKTIYVIVMLLAILLLAHFTHSPIN